MKKVSIRVWLQPILTGYLSFLFLILIGCSAWAMDKCDENLNKANLEAKTAGGPSHLSDFPFSYQINPSRSDVQRMLALPEVKGLKSKYGDGEKLLFDLGSVLGSELAQAAISGEWMQASFLAKILKDIFPKSLVNEGAKRPENNHRTVVELMIFDSAELQAQRLNNVDMLLLKPANFSLSGMPDKITLRQALQIPVDMNIASVYALGSIPMEHNPEEILNPVPILFEQGHFDMVFLSQGGATLSRNQFVGNGPNCVRLLLSELGQVEIHKGKRYLVLNDTKGRMPYIYRMSDLQLTIGRINIFEGLPTPTLFFDNPAIKGSYDNRGAFTQMADLAVKAGAIKLKVASDLAATLGNVSARENQRRVARSAAWVNDDQGLNAVQRLLRRLDEIIQRAVLTP